MNPICCQTRLLVRALATGALLGYITIAAHATMVTVTNLVSDNTSVHPALIQDPNLINAWGTSMSGTGPFWLSNNGTGTSTLYSVNPTTNATTKVALVVTIPGAGNLTGQVFNSTAGFNGDRFIFVSEDGTISGWRSTLGTSAETLQLASAGAVYKGVAFGSIGSNDYLYAANFRGGRIDVLGGTAVTPSLGGTFLDPTLPAGYAPFNIENLGGILYVAYAQQDATATDEIAGLGKGFVDRYDLSGNFLGRIASGGVLNAPWALTIAPTSFGTMAGALLVGNFGDGRINAYDPVTAALIGQLQDDQGKTLSIDGLWALTPGNGGSAGSPDNLYFTAGPDGESHGLFGVLKAVSSTSSLPEPSSLPLVALSLGLLVAVKRLRHMFTTRQVRKPTHPRRSNDHCPDAP